MTDSKTRLFEQNRQTLEGIAYRMLGTLDDARDVVQDTYIKWSETELADIQNPRAWLITVCSRLAINCLQSARIKRESYVGLWLPEPLVDSDNCDISAALELDETVSVALLLALEKLSPIERAVYLLHEVFDYSFAEVAGMLGKSNANCRQYAARARKQLRREKPRHSTSIQEHQQLLRSFIRAAHDGDLEQFKTILTDTVALYADGGGKAEAITDLLCGSQQVGKFFIQIWRQFAQQNVSVTTHMQWFNGSPGLLIFENNRLATAMTIDIYQGNIQSIYAIRNPDKLVPFSTDVI